MKNTKIIEKGSNTFKEFKQFISKGNIIDLAVGVIIGQAFGKIVTSLVNDILMPLIGVVSGGLDFSGLSYKIGDATIMYGVFIQNIIDFLIVAICIFVFIKLMSKLSKKKEVKEEKKVAENVLLLTEIRDLLKQQSNTNKNANSKKKS